jgi:4-hydroxy-3-polyprenylbenzoate decarboxylase
MVIVPCSMKTVAGVRTGFAQDLVGRAADVTLKEGRKLVMVARETPLSTIHLENLLALSRMGVTILPPTPAFYNHPKDLEDVVDHIVARTLDQFGLRLPSARRWSGLSEERHGRAATPAESEGRYGALPADDDIA